MIGRLTAHRTAVCVKLSLVLVLAWSTGPRPSIYAAQPVESAPASASAPALPELAGPVNDFASVIEPGANSELARMITALQQKTGDAVIVATVRTTEPYADIQEYAVKLYENHGKGIGERGKDNGALVLLAVDDRKVWIEVGYGLEGFITDGFAGETSRQYMAPFFKQGRYGDGLKAGVARLISRIAQERNVEIENLPAPPPMAPRSSRPQSIPFPLLLFVAFLVLQFVLRGRGGGRGRRHWTGGPWSGWSGGVGPFGGSYGGWGSGGGGFSGGGFGGFGGGRSGGGGGGASW